MSASAREQRRAAYLSSLYESSESNLKFDDFVKQVEKGEWLAVLGIDRVEIPSEYAKALGPDRTRLLEQRARSIAGDMFATVDTSSPLAMEAVKERAREFGAVARTLDLGLSTRVSELEFLRDSRRSELRELRIDQVDLEDSIEFFHVGDDPNTETIELSNPGPRLTLDDLRARLDQTNEKARVARAELDAARSELAELSTHEGHPAPWFKENERQFAASIAARKILRDARQQERQQDQPEQAASAPETPSAIEAATEREERQESPGMEF